MYLCRYEPKVVTQNYKNIKPDRPSPWMAGWDKKKNKWVDDLDSKTRPTAAKVITYYYSIF